jgi:hypothetical protein
MRKTFPFDVETLLRMNRVKKVIYNNQNTHDVIMPDILWVVLSAFISHVSQNSFYLVVLFVLPIVNLWVVVSLVVLVEHGHVLGILAVVRNLATTTSETNIWLVAAVPIGAWTRTTLLTSTSTVVRVRVGCGRALGWEDCDGRTMRGKRELEGAWGQTFWFTDFFSFIG